MRLWPQADAQPWRTVALGVLVIAVSATVVAYTVVGGVDEETRPGRQVLVFVASPFLVLAGIVGIVKGTRVIRSRSTRATAEPSERLARLSATHGAGRCRSFVQQVATRRAERLVLGRARGMSARGSYALAVAIQRIFYCDGPECEGHIRTITDFPSSGFIRTYQRWPGADEGSSPARRSGFRGSPWKSTALQRCASNGVPMEPRSVWTPPPVLAFHATS